MSVDGERKTFVIKHTFNDIKRDGNKWKWSGREETYFNIPWQVIVFSNEISAFANVYLNCNKQRGGDEFSIDTTVQTKVFAKGGEQVFRNKVVFSHKDESSHKYLGQLIPIDDYLVDGNLTIECHVTIHEMTGFEIPIEKILRSFDDESAKEFSDVVLKVKDQKFYVCKMYLAGHSSYFKSLLYGDFDESKQSEVELKDIDPEDFQNFLQVLYGEPTVDDDAVAGILHLADMYDAKTAIRHCETFLIKYSKQTHKEKFQMAIQYKLENLKKKCISEFKTSEEIATIIPDDSTQFNTEIWKELLHLSIALPKKQ